MSYKEYFENLTKRFNFDQSDLDLFYIDKAALLPDDLDDDVDVIKAKTALCSYFANIIPIASISEGGYNITWNIDALKLWYKLTCQELGLTPEGATPTAKNKSMVW